MSTGDLARLVKRHRAYWRGEGEGPLRQVSRHSPLAAHAPIPLADGTSAAEGMCITPDLIDPRRFFPEERGELPAGSGDFLSVAGPPHLCWTEAILGCPVRVVTGGPWAEPFVSDGADLDSIAADEQWLGKLDEFVHLLAERADGKYPIAEPLMRGPIDMMAAALGHEPMCVALMESPEETDALLSTCADIFIHTARRRLQHTPAFAGGQVSAFGIWAPGSVVRTQVDNSSLLSPAVYRDRVLKHDRRVIEAFDYSIIHLHSGCLHIADDLAAVEALGVIQVSIDYPGGPMAAEIMPILARILEKKPVLVTGPVTEAELGELEALSPPGRLGLQLAVIQDNTATLRSCAR